MSRYLFRLACFGLFAGTAAIGLQSPAHAIPITIPHTYYGGLDYCCQSSLTPQSQAVIGETSTEFPTSAFDVTSAVLTRDTGANTLSVTINTYFAGVPGNANQNIAALADGTTYGSLFLAPAANWNPTGTATNHYYEDTYHPAEWTYAFVTSGTSGGSGAVYAIGATQTAVTYGSPSSNPANVVQSYSTNAGSVIMSNAGGNPISYPNGGNPGYWFRQGQPVQYDPNSQASSTTGTWSIVPTTTNGSPAAEGSITYLINDFNSLNLGNDIAISWAMSCANGIIQGVADFGSGSNNAPPTPLPAALPLFAGGLGMMGLLGWRRRRKAAARRPR